MRFTIAAAVAFAASLVQAQIDGFNAITKPERDEVVEAGSVYDIVWQSSDAYPGLITIGLLGGETPQGLSVIDTIAKGVDPTVETYAWKVGATLGDLATYGIIITLESDAKTFQYGFPFKIKGPGSSTSSSASASVSATATESETSTASETGKATSAAVSSTSVVIPSSTTIISSTIRSNSSTSSTSGITITSLVTSTRGTPTGTATQTIVTNGVAQVAAGSFALFGGVLAAFAL
ncbi:hypothetical protein N0V88_006386 [Collariella sp. IMI 366227]|nr:hypothetical protein N0V88_006386 [Collariella sp. IMI 366227]